MKGVRGAGDQLGISVGAEMDRVDGFRVLAGKFPE